MDLEYINNAIKHERDRHANEIERLNDKKNKENETSRFRINYWQEKKKQAVEQKKASQKTISESNIDIKELLEKLNLILEKFIKENK